MDMTYEAVVYHDTGRSSQKGHRSLVPKMYTCTPILSEANDYDPCHHYFTLLGNGYTMICPQKPAIQCHYIRVFQSSPLQLNLTALTPQNIDDTIKSVNQGLANLNHLQKIIDTSPKSYILTGRMELDSKT
jgi:hypothetical protein